MDKSCFINYNKNVLYELFLLYNKQVCKTYIYKYMQKNIMYHQAKYKLHVLEIMKQAQQIYKENNSLFSSTIL